MFSFTGDDNDFLQDVFLHDFRIKEHKWAFEKGDLRSKLDYQALKRHHLPNVVMVMVLSSRVKLYESRMILMGVYTMLQPAGWMSFCKITP